MFFTFYTIGVCLFGVCLGMYGSYMITRTPKGGKPKPKLPEIDLYATMQSALKTVEDGWLTIYPPHKTNCRCGYCEIKHGVGNRQLRTTGEYTAVADKDAGAVYHPEFIRATFEKNKTLQMERDDLRAELERRDKKVREQMGAVAVARPVEEPIGRWVPPVDRIGSVPGLHV